MATRRQAILEGVQAAQRLQKILKIKERFAEGTLSRINVFQAAVDSGAGLLFRPLKGLLGAFLGQPVVPTPGIIITTQRELHVQRFTAAHELGHMCLEHQPSCDSQVGLWRNDAADLKEVAADSFASEFLLPRWLYVYHARRQSWKTRDLQNPDVVYQLSLRMGASYDATVWGLEGHKILGRNDVRKLRQVAPKTIKLRALGSRIPLSNPWANVWVLTENDNGLELEGGPDDIIILRFQENASAGYLWDDALLLSQGVEILSDEREAVEVSDCGGAVTRVLAIRVAEAGQYRVALSEKRPWNPSDVGEQFFASFDLRGKERGLSRNSRELMAAA